MENNPPSDVNSVTLSGFSKSYSLRWKHSMFAAQCPHLGTYPKSIISVVNSPSVSTTFGDWSTGGTGVAYKSISKHSGRDAWAWQILLSKLDSSNMGTQECYAAANRVAFLSQDIIIDWGTLLQNIRNDYTPVTYKIGRVLFCDGNYCYDVLSEGANITLEQLDQWYVHSPDSASSQVGLYGDKIHNWAIGYTGVTLPNGDAASVVSSYMASNFSRYADNLDFSADAAGLEFVNNQPPDNASTTFNVPMTIKVWLYFRDEDPEIHEFPSEAEVGDGDDPPPDPPDDDPINPSGGLSNFGSGGGGTSSYFPVKVHYGNAILPFDSVYMTGDDYNSFVAAEGGIVAESGIFPNGVSMFIEKISRSVEGSTMTIVQNSDFDDTPLLTKREKVFGYILNADGDTKPTFTGYVESIQKRLEGTAEEIVYECKDLTYYLDQFITPSYYIYSPPSHGGKGPIKTYDNIIKEILNRAGIPNANINLPDITSPPVNWIFENAKTVLEWGCKYFGNYVYYTDRYGILNVRAINSHTGTKTYTIPTRGTSVSDSYKALKFNPLTDMSRSRSRVILVGDFPISEKVVLGNYKLYATATEPKDAKKTGRYFYVDSDTRKMISYFILKPSQTLVSQLLSNPQASCKIEVLGHSYELLTLADAYLRPLEVGITNINTNVGVSAILAEDPVFNTRGTELVGGYWNSNTLIRSTFAIRDNDPLSAYADTGYSGGVEVLKRPEFKKINSSSYSIDDTSLMKTYLSYLTAYFTPIYGGKLELDGLIHDVDLLYKVTVNGTGLGSVETEDLIVYDITYDIINKKTTLSLSNKTFLDLPTFDPIRDRKRSDNEALVKMGILENAALYKRL